MHTNIFITGGTGYIGKRLITVLLKDGNYRVTALVRKGSENKLPAGCEVVYGNALDASSFINAVPNQSVFIQLVGVSHPSPSKKELFKTIDAVSVRESLKAAVANQVRHFIYLSVSQYPSNIMKDYQAVRAGGEEQLANSGLRCSFVRPWYVLGPGHWWPLLLKPFFWIAALHPAWKEKAKHFDLVTIQQMINILAYAIKNQPGKIEYYEIEDIRQHSLAFNKVPQIFWGMPKVQ